MDFVFGKRMYDGKETEFVKVISDEDYVQYINGKFVTHSYDNGFINITHTFRICWKFKQDKSLDGKFQTWYYIDSHTKEIDNSKLIQSVVDELQEQLQEKSNLIDSLINILCENDILTDKDKKTLLGKK